MPSTTTSTSSTRGRRRPPGSTPRATAAYQSAKAANNSLSTRALLSAGTGTYPGTRWGDYVGVAQDPQVPNAVWQGNEFSAGADFWATEVSQLQTGGNSYVPIVPVRVLDTRFGTGSSGRVQRERPAQLPGRGRPSGSRPMRSRHRQRDGRRPDVGRLPLDHPDAGPQPADVDASTSRSATTGRTTSRRRSPATASWPPSTRPRPAARPTSSSTSPATSLPATPTRPTRRSPRSGSSTHGRASGSASAACSIRTPRGR